MAEKGILERIESKLDTVIDLLGSEIGINTVPQKAAKTAADETDDWGDVPKENVEKAAPAEKAARNRWIELVDGSVVFVKKGETLPTATDIKKNSTKAAYEEYVASVAGDESAGDDEGWDDADGTGDDEDWDDEQTDDEQVAEVKEAVSFKNFAELVKAFGANGKGARAQKLMVKHSTDGKTASIKQYEENIEGRNEIFEVLQSNWKGFAAVAKKLKI